MIFFSPSLYVTVSVWPSIPAAWLATVALVIVLLGKSQFEKPSGGCTLGGKMRIAIAFWLPSGCGEAVMARYEPSFMSESGAFTTSLTGAPASVRVRATIASVDGGTLTAKARDGGEMKIKLADKRQWRSRQPSSVSSSPSSSSRCCNCGPRLKNSTTTIFWRIGLGKGRKMRADKVEYSRQKRRALGRRGAKRRNFCCGA